MDVITEPATLVTDYLLAAFAAVLSWRLRSGGIPQRWWAAALAATALAGICGGTVHGFVRVLPPAVTAGLWLLTLELLVGSGLAVAMATLAVTPMTPRTRGVVTWSLVLAVIAYAAWVPARPVFAVAIAAYGVSLLGVALVESRRWWTQRTPASAWLLAGVAVSVAAAVVQQGGWAPHRFFNHNDLFHVIQAGALWLLYRGATLSRSAGPIAT